MIWVLEVLRLACLCQDLALGSTEGQAMGMMATALATRDGSVAPACRSVRSRNLRYVKSGPLATGTDLDYLPSTSKAWANEKAKTTPQPKK